MALAAAGVACYEAALAAEPCDFWEATLPDDCGRRTTSGTASSSPTAPTPTTTTTTRRPSTAASARRRDDVVDQELGADGPRARLHRARVGDRRGHLPDLPRPLPQRRARTTTRRPATSATTTRSSHLPWGALPEGYCRNYADGATNCPWRFDTTPPADLARPRSSRAAATTWAATCKGVDQKLDYLKTLGVNTIYFNPIFDAGSNHSYDTQDYTRIDPYFGTQKDWENLVKHADERGIRIILDGVFNHMSSRQPVLRPLPPLPDGRRLRVGRLRRTAPGSPSRRIGRTATCAGPRRPEHHDLRGLVRLRLDPGPQQDQPRGPGLLPHRRRQRSPRAGSTTAPPAGGWTCPATRPSRTATGRRSATSSKATDPDALIISETWQKDSTLLRMIRGDRLDTTMNYRLRDAVLGLLAPQALRLEGLRRQRPPDHAVRVRRPASRRSARTTPTPPTTRLMNLLDSHDTERLLLDADARAPRRRPAKELNAANLAAGKRAPAARLAHPVHRARRADRLLRRRGRRDRRRRSRRPPHLPVGGHWAARPTRRCSPTTRRSPRCATRHPGADRWRLPRARWPTTPPAPSPTAARPTRRRRSSPSTAATRRAVADHPRRRLPARRHRRSSRRTACGEHAATGSVTVAGGELAVTLPALSAAVLADRHDRPRAARRADGPRTSPARSPTQVTPGLERVGRGRRLRRLRQPALGRRLREGQRRAVTGTDVHRSPGSRTPAATTSSSARSTRPATQSDPSNEVERHPAPDDRLGQPAVAADDDPHHQRHRPDRQRLRPGLDRRRDEPARRRRPACAPSSASGPTAAIPAGNAGLDVGGRRLQHRRRQQRRVRRVAAARGDRHVRLRLPLHARPTAATGSTPTSTGSERLPTGPGRRADGHCRAATRRRRPTPTGLHVVIGASPAGIELAWDAVAGDATLYGYEVRRAARVRRAVHRHRARLGGTSFTDTAVVEGATYYYVVRAVDTSFNRSGRVGRGRGDGRAADRDADVQRHRARRRPTRTGRSVYIAGFLDRLDGGYPQWDPGGVVADPGRRHALDDHLHRQGGHPARVQVRARRPGTTSRRTARAARSPTAS